MSLDADIGFTFREEGKEEPLFIISVSDIEKVRQSIGESDIEDIHLCGKAVTEDEEKKKDVVGRGIYSNRKKLMERRDHIMYILGAPEYQSLLDAIHKADTSRILLIENKRSSLGATFFKSLLLILAFILALYTLYSFLYGFFERQIRDEEIHREKEVMAHYIPIDTTASLGNRHRGSSTGERMYLHAPQGDGASVKCPVTIDLDSETTYVTEAPIGRIIYKNGTWYIAKVLTKFASKDEVKRHIESCIPLLLKKYQDNKKREEANKKSWEQTKELPKREAAR